MADPVDLEKEVAKLKKLLAHKSKLYDECYLQNEKLHKENITLKKHIDVLLKANKALKSK